MWLQTTVPVKTQTFERCFKFAWNSWNHQTWPKLLHKNLRFWLVCEGLDAPIDGVPCHSVSARWKSSKNPRPWKVIFQRGLAIRHSANSIRLSKNSNCFCRLSFWSYPGSKVSAKSQPWYSGSTGCSSMGLDLLLWVPTRLTWLGRSIAIAL